MAELTVNISSHYLPSFLLFSGAAAQQTLLYNYKSWQWSINSIMRIRTASWNIYRWIRRSFREIYIIFISTSGNFISHLNNFSTLLAFIIFLFILYLRQSETKEMKDNFYTSEMKAGLKSVFLYNPCPLYEPIKLLWGFQMFF